jgi:hypothetical protein
MRHRRPSAPAVAAAALAALAALAATALLATGCDRAPAGGATAAGTRTAAPLPQPAAGDGAAAAAAQEPDPAGAASTPPVAAPAGISFAFDPPQLDFGILRPKQAVNGAFRLENTGTTALRVGAMKASCACTTMEPLSDRELEPGEAVEIKLELEGRSSGGTRSTAIDFVLEGPDRQVVRTQYQLTAEYARAIRQVPGYINLLQDLTGTVKLEALDGRPFRVLSVMGEAPEHVSFDSAADEVRTEHEVRYDFRGFDAACRDAQGRPMPKYMAIETDHPDAPLIDLAVRHTCTVPRPEEMRGRTWYVTEPVHNLGALLPGEPVELELETMWFSRARDHSATIHAVQSETPQVQAKLIEVVPTDQGYSCRIELRPIAGFTGLLYGHVKIHSEQHDQVVVVLATVRDDVLAETAGN